MQLSSDRAIDLNGKIHDISILKLRINPGDFAPFYVLHCDRIAYGFNTKPGQIIACACENDMLIKAWRYSYFDSSRVVTEPWIRCEWELCGKHSHSTIRFFEINSPKNGGSYATWKPAYPDSRTGRREVLFYKDNTLQSNRKRMLFGEFMQAYFPHILEIANNAA